MNSSSNVELQNGDNDDTYRDSQPQPHIAIVICKLKHPVLCALCTQSYHSKEIAWH